MTTTPNMGMVLPDEGGSADVWGVLLDAVFSTRLDIHDHSVGLGVKVPSAGLNINADLSFASFALTNAKAVRFAAVAAGTVTSYAGALFLNSADSELYYRTVGGSNVKVTNGAALNVTAFTGGIGGDYSAVGALVQYEDAGDRYLFQQQLSTIRQWARLDAADLDLYEYHPAGNVTSVTNRVRQKSPAALAGSYDVTWLAALPGAQSLMQVDTAGQLLATNVLVANANITLSGTGLYKHGAYTKSHSISSILNVVSTGGVATRAPLPGVLQSATAQVFYPVGDMHAEELVTGIRMRLGAVPGANVTYEFYAHDYTGAPDSFVLLGGSTVSAGVSVLMTPSGPYTGGIQLVAGQALWVKVTTGAATAVLVGMDVTYSV